MRPSLAHVSLALLALSIIGCGATVEVPRICFTQAGLTVLGTPTGGSVTEPVTFSIDITNQIPLLRPNSSDMDLRVDTVVITPTAGSPDLSGVQAAVVQVQPATGSAVEVVHYQRNPAAPAPATIVLDGDTVNVAPYLENGRATFVFTLSGQPPRTTWTAALETCIRGQTTVSP